MVIADRQPRWQIIVFAIMSVLFGLMEKGVHLTFIQNGNSCNITEAKPFVGKKLNVPALEIFCVEQPGECFAKCTGNRECRSFGIAEVTECPGSLQCLLYSQQIKDTSYFIKNKYHSYYVLEAPTCCESPCVNNKLCDSKTCECKCPQGYNSYRCMCHQSNLSEVFDNDSGVMLSGAMKQVDSGEQTWGIKEDNTVWILLNDKWEDTNIPERFTYITSGKAGVWGINTTYDVFARKGITLNDLIGTSWENIPGQKLVQIDSGSSGVVYGVNGADEIYCRTGITNALPFGSGWANVSGTAKHVSCGDYGCWAVRPDNSVAFRQGVTLGNCTGTGWIDIPAGGYEQLDSGLTGSLYAISLTSTNHTLRRIGGICGNLPWGTKHWRGKLQGRFKHVTVGDSHMYAVAENGTVFKFSP